MKLTQCGIYLYLFIRFFTPLSTSFAQMPEIPIKHPAEQRIEDFINQKINTTIFSERTGYYKKDSTKLDTFIILAKSKTIAIHLDKQFAHAPFRPSTVAWLKKEAAIYLGELYENFSIELYSNNKTLETYIPNFYRETKREFDYSRIPKKQKQKTAPLVKNISKPFIQNSSLTSINIALWQSHGWYYESSLDRWEWQRARLFQTVEDISTAAFVLQGIVPMLENAGAQVFLPRERSCQTNEVIVDNNGSHNSSIYQQNSTLNNEAIGFAIGNPPYIKENPFNLGTSISFKSNKKSKEFIEWIPDIPTEGFYPVYISYHHNSKNTDKAIYTVYHCGGSTQFQVNQQMGGETWIYLGTFKFNTGINPETGKVNLSGITYKNNQIITADAVRFGGGMGNISRNNKISGRPRYQEAARYYLQYAGMPDTLVWYLNTDKENDYVDDYQSRGEWISYLMGSTGEPKKNKTITGLEIPVDLALAFHTDAGIAKADSVIGTLGIYNTTMRGTTFPNGVSKMASRDLTDLIQSQLVADLRSKYDTSWIRRGMWDKPYSEAFRPNVPTMLLELLSHQNFLDARFAQEPQFRFDVSRAIYKGMLRFLSIQNNIEYVVQPLPISHFTMEQNASNNLLLKWLPVGDSLEPTAEATGFIVYTRKNNQGFDNGQYLKTPELLLTNLEPETIYSFKVTAINKGGESFPSEILSAAFAQNSKGKVLIVNAFDRISGPAALNETNMAGYMDRIDEGVAYHSNIHTTGTQYDYDRNSPWLDDDSPGFGASGAEMEDKIIPGNTFDFSYVHGQSILKAGFSFASTSDEAYSEHSVNSTNYFMIDIVAGEEKTHFMPKNDSVPHFTIFNNSLINTLKQYLQSGGNVLITGAHIGTDVKNNKQDSVIGSVLKYKWRTNHASRFGTAHFIDTSFSPSNQAIHFNTTYNPTIYKVEAPDAIEPFDISASTIMRYSENNMSAGVIYNGSYKVAAFGFPFETILDASQRNTFMQNIMHFFDKKTNQINQE